MPDNMTFDEALEQLRRIAKRHEGMKGLLHEIANAMEWNRSVLTLEFLREVATPVEFDYSIDQIREIVERYGFKLQEDK